MNWLLERLEGFFFRLRVLIHNRNEHAALQHWVQRYEGYSSENLRRILSQKVIPHEQRWGIMMVLGARGAPTTPLFKGYKRGPFSKEARPFGKRG